MSEKKTDRRTLKTRKAICAAFAELLYEKELHKITVQEIFDKADVNRVTFYKHYLDVYDLYDKLEADVLVELGLLILQLDEVRSEEFFSCLIGYVADNRSIFRTMFSPNGTNHLRDKFGRLMEGLFRKLTAEKLERGLSDNRIEYFSCYRTQGCFPGLTPTSVSTSSTTPMSISISSIWATIRNVFMRRAPAFSSTA